MRYPIHLLNIFLLIVSFCSSTLASRDDSLQFEYHKAKSSHWQGKNLDSSYHHAAIMLSIGKKNNNSVQIRDGLLHIGLAFDYQYQFDTAKYYYKEANHHSIKHHDSLGIGMSLLNIGVVFYFQGILDSAIYYYEQSRPVFEQIKNNKYLSANLNNLALIYKKVGNYQNAIEVYQKSLEIKLQLRDTAAIINSYLNLSSAYIATKEYQKAIDYALKVTQLAELSNNKNDMASALVNAGIAYKAKKNYQKAFQSFLKSEELIGKNTDEKWSIYLYFNLAELYRDTKNISKALKYLNKMENILPKDAFLEEHLACYQLASELYKSTNQIYKAFHYLEKYVEVKEKYLSQSVQETVNSLEKKYESELKERQIILLELENKNSVIALISSKNQRNISILIAIVLLVTAFLLYFLFREKKNSLAQREVLLKEIHHRVKNNLQIISSLLNQQSRYTDNKSALEVVQESRNRVKSMAIIHQKLYQEGNLTGVSISNYIENLAASLFNSYGIDQDRVCLKTDIEDLNLDIDTIIPLGLILNELITNALKYAFPDEQSGTILISLKHAHDKLILLIKDNGVGMKKEIDLENSKSFGLKLVNSLSNKLKATIDIENSSGTSVSLHISHYKLA